MENNLEKCQVKVGTITIMVTMPAERVPTLRRAERKLDDLVNRARKRKQEPLVQDSQNLNPVEQANLEYSVMAEAALRCAVWWQEQEERNARNDDMASRFQSLTDRLHLLE